MDMDDEQQETVEQVAFNPTFSEQGVQDTFSNAGLLQLPHDYQQRIVYDIAPPASIHTDPTSQMHQASAKHKERSQRFQIPFVQPAPGHVLSQTEFAKQKYANPSGAFVTGFDIGSSQEREKINARKNRFGSAVQDPQSLLDPALQSELEKLKRKHRFGQANEAVREFHEQETTSVMDLDPRIQPHNPSAEAAIRTDAVHMYGTDQMSTQDVLAYFSEYGPAFVEWINDSSCNIVWEDNYSSLRALLGLSISERTAVTGEDPLRLAEADLNGAALEWRIARPSAKASAIRLRFATSEDKKQFSAAQQSAYYKLHGRPSANRGQRVPRQTRMDTGDAGGVGQLRQQRQQTLRQAGRDSRDSRLNSARSQHSDMQMSASDSEANALPRGSGRRARGRGGSRNQSRHSGGKKMDTIDAVSIAEQKARASVLKAAITNVLDSDASLQLAILGSSGQTHLP